MERTLYAAYGSNMNLTQMRMRCPMAKVVGNSMLKGYELLFRGSHGHAVATVEPKKGGSVPVLVWEITPSCEANLDRYEGFPSFYRKETVKVRIGNKSEEVMVYIMNDGHPLNLPSRFYYNGIIDGYTAAGIPLDVLQQALVRVKQPDDCVADDTAGNGDGGEPAE